MAEDRPDRSVGREMSPITLIEGLIRYDPVAMDIATLRKAPGHRARWLFRLVPSWRVPVRLNVAEFEGLKTANLAIEEEVNPLA